MTVLYLTPEADRYFLVPEGHHLGAGDMLIASFTGEERRVDAAALAPLEVSRDDAEAHLWAQTDRVIAAVADRIGLAIGDPGALAEKLGLGGQRDHKAAKAALDCLSDDLQVLSTAVTSGEAADLDAARRRLAGRGIDVGAAFDELPRHLEAARRLEPDDAARAAARSLRALADAIEDEREPLGRRIDELIERLEREVGPLVGSNPEREEKRRRAEYRALAKSSIAEALRARGITPVASAEADEDADRTD